MGSVQSMSENDSVMFLINYDSGTALTLTL